MTLLSTANRRRRLSKSRGSRMDRRSVERLGRLALVRLDVGRLMIGLLVHPDGSCMDRMWQCNAAKGVSEGRPRSMAAATSPDTGYWIFSNKNRELGQPAASQPVSCRLAVHEEAWGAGPRPARNGQLRSWSLPIARVEDSQLDQLGLGRCGPVGVAA